ncbi:MAG: hypothetical protein HYR96_08985 [Deltaproteobacteria bacterium]|nr:hypothetical protein [Deltaproteobacteria bacterium]MBI3293219.1 hypothetical protein [Deltaproteobacteria bacterium]
MPERINGSDASVSRLVDATVPECFDASVSERNDAAMPECFDASMSKRIDARVSECDAVESPGRQKERVESRKTLAVASKTEEQGIAGGKVRA